MGKSKDSKSAGAKGGSGGKADKADKSNKKGGGSNSKAEGGDAKATKLKGTTINVRHILCEKFTKSEEAMNRLKNGEKFDVVAREMSEDKAKAGGSLGWKTKGSLDPQFEEVAFRLPPSPVDSPTYERVKTGFGYHIIMVEGRK
ncbi:FKBP-like protein [Thermothelomyces heterothallicus CBS 203.75]